MRSCLSAVGVTVGLAILELVIYEDEIAVSAKISIVLGLEVRRWLTSVRSAQP